MKQTPRIYLLAEWQPDMFHKNRRFLLSGLFLLPPLTFLTAILPTQADAAPIANVPAVVAVNREIGLSVTGNFENATNHTGIFRSYQGIFPLNHVVPEFNAPSFTSTRSHASGWTPGFRTDAQYMFDAGNIKHLYASATFTLDNGDIDYGSKTTSTASKAIWLSPTTGAPNGITNHNQQNRRVNRSGINVTGEFGKAFLLLNDRLLVMPTIQGGYRTEASNTFTGYGKGYVGLALHIDYAITDRLVIRGRGGWA